MQTDEYTAIPEKGTAEELVRRASSRYAGRPVMWLDGRLCFELSGTKGLNNKTPVPGTWEVVNK